MGSDNRRRYLDTRMSSRRTIDMQVTITHSGIPVSVCQCRDIGLEGIFVDCGPLDYALNTQLEVVFHSEISNFEIRLKVIVIHRNERGMGLMFINMGIPELIAVNTVLHADDGGMMLRRWPPLLAERRRVCI